MKKIALVLVSVLCLAIPVSAGAAPSLTVPTGDLTMTAPDPIVWGDTVSFSYTADVNAKVELRCYVSEAQRYVVRLSGRRAILNDWAPDVPATCYAILSSRDGVALDSLTFDVAAAPVDPAP